MLKPLALSRAKTLLVAACLTFLATGRLEAQTGNVVVSTSTTWPTGTYNLTSLTVQSGATLTVGGGSTIAVSGPVVVTQASGLVLQGINTSAQVGGAWAGAGVTVNAASVRVDAGSSINADAQGYLAQAGPGAGAQGNSGSGGSYGGVGGGQLASTIYGSATAPTDLGSGGGQYQSPGGIGGGAIRLVVSGTLTDNGVISANGQSVSGFAAGGAGGSIYVTTNGLAGSGTFLAGGGNNSTTYGSAGGGGRIAVYFAANGGFTGFSTSTANGGTVASPGNGTTVAGAGTVAFYDTSAPNTNLDVYENYTIPANVTQTYNAISVQNGATLTIGGGSTITVTNAITVTGNSNIVVQSINNTGQVNGKWQGQGSTLNAATVQVDAGSTINADQQGYIVQSGPGAGASGNSDAGGSYGGAGGGETGATVYGSTTAPVDLGSGGGQYQNTVTPGGGAIRLAVSGTLTNNGIISANAGPVTGFAGGSAGGSLYVTTATLVGSGSFRANGGSNATSYGSAGGGGRIAIYYNSAAGFTAFASATASGGTITNPGNGGTPGSNGTTGFFDTSVTNSKLSVYQNFTIAPSANVTYNQISVQNAGLLTVGGGTTVNATAGILVTGKSTIIAQAINNTAVVNGTWQGQGVTLNAATLQVDAGSSLNADQQGYIFQAGPGAGGSGNSDAGGSYGGAGGGEPASAVYGSATAPVDLGSGGGQYQSASLPGGGAIRLAISGTLTNNGTISANAGPVTGFAAGSAGGSIYITTATLAGSGAFQANGGPNATSYGSGGGGGRIAIYYASAPNFTAFTGATATGGSVANPGNGGTAGSNGTVAFFNTAAANNNVSIYQNYAIAAGSNTQYNSLNLAAGATLTIGGGAQLVIAQSLLVTGTITAQSTNTTASTAIGRGIKITAGSVQVDAAGSIVADNQGYVATAGPGAGTPGQSQSGGSYGGAGNDQPASSTYGSANAPIDLGSGGAQYQGTAGAGGGAIQIFATGTFTNNGVVSANGQAVSGFVGGGAGGSLYIGANTLTGSGTFSATGGLNSTTAGGGGGGGRIAIYAINSSNYSKANISVAGGTEQGAPSGSVGSLVFSNNPISAFITPTQTVLHGTVTLQWFTDGGAGTTVLFAGPQTLTVAQGSSSFSTATFDTTTLPDGRYELRLLVLDANGKTIGEVAQPEVINNSVTWHSGTLTANDEWTPAHVHGLDGNVIIPAGITLTIDPGTIVKALAGAQLIVQSGGILNALGANGQQVIFTTFDDYTVGGNTDFNQGISLPAPGEWGGISVQGGGAFNSNGNTIVRYAQAQLSGTLAANTTLLPTQVYQINGTLVVPSGITLNMLPGTIVKFGAGAGIDAQPGSNLLANGTLAQPIYLTSLNDTSIGGNTNASTNGAPAAPGDWNSILIDGANASFNFVQMQYGGGPVISGSQVGMLETSEAATVKVANTTLASSFFIGLQTGYPNGGGDTVTVTNTTFYGIQDRAVNTFGGSTVHLVNDTFDSNAAGVFNHGGTVDLENSVVTNSLSTQFGGIGLCCGGVYAAMVNNDNFNPASGVSNYIGMADPTGTNGNISANPVYMNGPQHDYRPTYGSPAIDAANGNVPNYPTTDAYNDPRFNAPEVTVKKGTADASGKFPDMGAFEFVQGAPSDLDLTASGVEGPSTALVGTQVQVTWTITNIGQGTAYGPWHDSVFLVTSPNTNPVETLAGTFLEGSNIVLGPGATYSGTATVTVPGTVVGPHHWEVKTNVRGEVFEGANTANNTSVSLDPVNVDLTQLVAGAAASSSTFAATGASAYYKVIPATNQTTRIQIALTGASVGSVQLFVGSGYIPTPQHFDYQQVEFDSPTASVVIPSGTDQTFYVTAYAQSLAMPLQTFTIQATAVQFSLVSVSPNATATGASSTLTFTGGGFTAGTTYSLVSASGVSYMPSAVFLADSDHADLTFDLTKVPAGIYSAQAVNGTTATLAAALKLTAAPTTANYSPVTTWVETPTAFRAGFPATITLHYTNNTTSDIPAPLIYINASGATLQEIPPTCTGCNPGYAQQYATTYSSGLVLGINHQGPAGILPAGATDSISFLATATATASQAAFYASSVGSDIVGTRTYQELYICGIQPGFCVAATQNVGAYPTAASFCASLTAPGTSAAAVSRACMAMLNNSGYTYVPYQYPGFNANIPYSLLNTYVMAHETFAGINAMLAANATTLSAQGDYEYDAQKLFAYELRKDGLGQLNTLYHQGAFGFGPSHPYDITGDTAAGAPTIHNPDGSARIFATPSSTPNVMLGSVGDYGTLTINADGSWLLTEPDGTLYHLALTGSTHALDYIQDRAGNKITLTYTNGVVTSAADSYGNAITYAYDALNHIVKATDPVGITTTFTYQTLNDARKSTFLTSSTSPAGTTTYTWNEGGKSGVGYIDDSCIPTYCEAPIGLASVAFPDGTHNYFTYDAIGRLVSTSGDANANAQSLAYTNTGFTLTNGLGKATTLTTNVGGSPLAVTDPLGNLTRFQYDPENKPVAVLGSLGDSTRLTYDAQGNPASLATPLGSTASFNWGADQSLLSLTDPDGNATQYTYDGKYNVISIVAPNNQTSGATYDQHGRIATFTNLRGKTVTYTYTASGLPLTKTFSNGAQLSYTYDAHNNLLTTTSPAGTTAFTYDADNRITTVTNIDGTSLTYTYNSGGQRSRMTDSTGFITNYIYDAAGRFSSLTNASGTPIVTYTFDPAGRITTRAYGNGTSANLTYDNGGNVSSIINKSASGAKLSEYDYTYDTENRPVTVSSPTGNLTYSYDVDGQLTALGTPAGSIQYSYDPAGNRTQVTSGSASTVYQLNNLNQYTSVGAGAYQYDADGNMIAGNGYTYTYDDESQMLSMASATDQYTFAYDGLGNRVSTTHNGVTTNSLIDPFNLGDVTADFIAGKPVAHYTHGYGLVSETQASGATGFYHFDAAGNTTQITGTTGSVLNSYVYLPFGEQTVLSAGLPNPYTFGGQFGAHDDGTGVYNMRARVYNPALGRFLQQDPLGFGGQDTNLYRYVFNNPASYVDPYGTCDSNPNSVGNVASNSFSTVSGLFTGVAGHASNVVGFGQALSALACDGKKPAYESLHDGTLLLLSGVSSGLPAKPPANPYALVLYYLVKNAGALDQGSQIILNNYFTYPVPNPLVCGTCITKPTPPFIGPIQKSIDPNGKLTSGFGNPGYVPAGAAITYNVYFENQSTATAPAQKVTVTDQLPANLDLSTLQVTQVAFNNATLAVPSNTQTYSAQMSVATDPNPVQVQAQLNPANGLLTFTMQSVDAVTGSAPADPLAGFLPPNNSANAGVGSVTFTIKPKAGLANTTAITNIASIVFDNNAAITTNSVVNTLDLSSPISSIGTLPSSTTNGAIPVTWSGTDPMGSGIASYNIYVAIDGGTPMLWLSATTATSATYTGYAGHTYAFTSLATNNVGNQQTTATTPQTVAVVMVTPVVTVTPASSMIQASQPLSVAISVATSNAVVPSGTVTLASGAYTSTAVTLVSGAATIVIPAGALAAGADTLTATYTPDTAGTQAYNPSSGTASVTVGSSNVQVTVGTMPTGQSFSVDGTAYTTTQTLTWINGSTHTLATTSPQTANGTQATFTAWSDAGAISHTVTAGAGTTTYTASFATAYQLTTAATPAAGGTVTPATGIFYPSGTVVPITATPAAGYTFSKWTGNVASSTSASTTVTLNTPQTVTANFTLIPVPTVTLTPATLTFTSAAGTPSAAQTAQLTNTSTFPLAITSIALTGTNASLFTQTNTCGTSLAAGANCTISVIFSPANAGSFTASVTITDNATGSPQTVALSGTGTAVAAPTFTFSATPPSQTIPAVGAANYTLTVTPQGGAIATPVTFTANGGPANALITFAPNSVTPGSAAATTIMTVQLGPAHARNELPFWPVGTPVLALAGACFLATRRNRRWLSGLLLAVLSIAAIGTITGCGGGSSYTITVTATSGTQTQTTQVTLNVH